ncbi:chemotaxis protein CheD [Alkalibacillus aidingensis]|uniref:chemotaxis protein CheD n=1 Tax=Alkalibacillus aidingensis TaxID=2747607 RepID=UPI001660B523|nr:chemotaxis protein CheD [Alkalibacillus aidingensis]
MTKVAEAVKVGIAGLDIAKHPQTIMTSGLGSCIGVILYEERLQIAGLVHVMLPDSSMARTESYKPGKFADTGISHLIKQLSKHGATKSHLKAKMAGGAQMFDVKNGSEMMRIGYRNAEAVKKQLIEHQIPLIAEDIGGSRGRTIEFLIDQSCLKIRTIHEGTSYI